MRRPLDDEKYAPSLSRRELELQMSRARALAREFPDGAWKRHWRRYGKACEDLIALYVAMEVEAVAYPLRPRQGLLRRLWRRLTLQRVLP